MRVFCRVRPHPESAVRCLPGSTALTLASDGREHAFSFDRVFGPTSTQQEVFGSVSELVQSALDGYHVCLFSYGQTGAGKTYTMQGAPTPQHRGIIPRSVEKARPLACLVDCCCCAPPSAATCRSPRWGCAPKLTKQPSR